MLWIVVAAILTMFALLALVQSPLQQKHSDLRATPRVCLVTGASRGIGQETAKQLAAQGDLVVVSARTLADAERSAQGIQNAVAVELDVLNPTSRAKAVEFIYALFGRLDVLVNNAGVVGRDKSESRVQACNFEAARALAELCLPYMLQWGYGRIVNLGSVLALRTKRGAYGESKRQLHNWTQSIGWKLCGSGVTVNAVCVSARTRMSPKSRYTVGQAAQAVVFACNMQDPNVSGRVLRQTGL
jgi:NAD(P)-dependent dehydrogenase (short-subunit alcohol dehydrogenase family)